MAYRVPFLTLNKMLFLVSVLYPTMNTIIIAMMTLKFNNETIPNSFRSNASGRIIAKQAPRFKLKSRMTVITSLIEIFSFDYTLDSFDSTSS